MTVEAFDLADKYRTPIIIAVDGILGQMMEPVVFPEQKSFDGFPAKEWVADGCLGREKRNVGSYCLTPEVGEKNCTLWQKKHEEMALEERWDTYKVEDAEYVFVAFGTTARIVESAVDLAREEGIKAGLIRPITLWPFPVKAFKGLEGKIKGLMSVELSIGQMIQDVKLAIECKLPVEFYGRQGGMMPTPEEVLKAFKDKLVNKYV